MKEVLENLLGLYHAQIEELEVIHKNNQDYLATAVGLPLAEVEARMLFARDNHRRLEAAKLERELLKYHYDKLVNPNTGF